MARWVCLFICCLIAGLSAAGWTHLELGAGNYGPDGHTKASLALTVRQKVHFVPGQKSFLDELEEMGRGDYNPEEQYGVLFWTLDELVKRQGPIGVFHVNDLCDRYALFAAEKLSQYAQQQGYDQVVIEAVPGDYLWLDAKQTLAQYGKDRYSTVHLKNPEFSLYYDTLDGNELHTSAASRAKTRQMLQNLANLSESGLFLFLIDRDFLIPREEKEEFMEQNVFYQSTSEWEAVPYIFPEGNVYEKATNKVFHILESVSD